MRCRSHAGGSAPETGQHPRRRILADPTFAANVDALRAELDSYDPMARIEAALHDELLTTQR